RPEQHSKPPTPAPSLRGGAFCRRGNPVRAVGTEPMDCRVTTFLAMTVARKSLGIRNSGMCLPPSLPGGVFRRRGNPVWAAGTEPVDCHVTAFPAMTKPITPRVENPDEH